MQNKVIATTFIFSLFLAILTTTALISQKVYAQPQETCPPSCPTLNIVITDLPREEQKAINTEEQAINTAEQQCHGERDTTTHAVHVVCR